MTCDLAIGDRSYSSWSLRGWLLFEKFGLSCRTDQARLYDRDFDALMGRFAPARTVPAVRFEDGTVIGDSLAIAEELATRHPGAGHWPADPSLRATARMLAAEMHSGFSDLRSECPMNLCVSYEAAPVSDKVHADLRRIEALWTHARRLSGSDTPWLFGTYSAADAFFAPVAARIAGYGLPVSPEAAAYVQAHLADPSFRRWRAMGAAEGSDQPFYARDYARRDWPGPKPLAAAVSDGPSENSACPYSGRPVTHFLSLGGRSFGFCNAFCRDKTRADPEAWPAFMAVVNPS